MSIFDPTDRLIEERERVEAALASLYASFTPGDSLGFGKRVGDGTHVAVDRLVDVGKQEVLLRKLEALERAEARLEEGSYGTCEVCGDAIPLARLEARPWSVRCVRHA